MEQTDAVKRAGHFNVGQHQVEALLRGHGQGVGAVVDAGDFEAFSLQDQPQVLGLCPGVLRDENPSHGKPFHAGAAGRPRPQAGARASLYDDLRGS